jgi:hypothetical protein
VKRLRIERRADQDACPNERDRIDRELAKLLTAIKAGGPIPAIVAEMKRLDSRRTELADMLSFAAGKRKPGFLSEAGLLGDLVSPVSVVAGVGFEPTTFRL